MSYANLSPKSGRNFSETLVAQIKPHFMDNFAFHTISSISFYVLSCTDRKQFTGTCAIWPVQVVEGGTGAMFHGV